MRINKADLDQMLEVLCNATDHRIDFSYDKMPEGFRLVSERGSIEHSPRLSKPEMYRWMDAFIDGVTLSNWYGYPHYRAYEKEVNA